MAVRIKRDVQNSVKNPIIIKTNTDIDTCKGLVLILQKSYLWKILIKKTTTKKQTIFVLTYDIQLHDGH